MDHGKAVKAPVRTARPSGNGVTRPLGPLPSIADPQVLLDALPLAVLLVQPSPDDRWIIVASNQLFDSWAHLSQHGALGLDRKSVVEGQSVSGRGDPGGSRIINKNKKQSTEEKNAT